MLTLRRSIVHIFVMLTLAAASCGGSGAEQVSKPGAAGHAGAVGDASGAEGSGAGVTGADSGAEEGDAETGADAGNAGAVPGASRRAAEGSSAVRGDAGGAGTPAPPAPTASDALRPAVPGLYQYDTDGTSETSGPLGGAETLPEETTLTVEAPEGGRQRAVRDMRDDAGDGTVMTVGLLYQDDGVYLEYLKITATTSGIAVTFEFVFDQPQIIIPTAAEVGYRNEFSTTSTDGGITADIAVDITGEETLTIGGAAVETFVLVTHITFHGDVEGEARLTDNVDRGRSLRVREQLVSDTRVAGVESHTESLSTLRSLDPAGSQS